MAQTTSFRKPRNNERNFRVKIYADQEAYLSVPIRLNDGRQE